MSSEERPWSSDENFSISKSKEPELPARRKSTPVVKVPRPRWVLHLQAQMWRFLMRIGMYLHRLAPPHPPKPAFVRSIPARLSGIPGTITLNFYTPMGYDVQKKLYSGKPLELEEQATKDGRRRSVISQVGNSIKRRSSGQRRWGAYPVVINFHGGGFTLGTAGDDGRWCGTVVDECQAVVISVDYRLAPEHPFPTAVEDGVDAVVWVHQHALDLGIDRQKIALSGFSSGGNMAFTVPLRLHDELTGFERDGEDAGGLSSIDELPPSSQASSSTIHRGSVGAGTNLVSSPRDGKNRARVNTKDLSALSDISIRAIIPWYPSLDYTRTREQRRATNVRKDQELSSLFTDLFDESYLHPPKTISLDSPYLSPGVAPDTLLKNGLPQDIILHTCEWDMLLDEGRAFHERLVAPPLNKNVFYKMIEGVPHGWDKAPNPWKPTPGVREHYLRACRELKRIFNAKGVVLADTEEVLGIAHRKSLPLNR